MSRSLLWVLVFSIFLILKLIVKGNPSSIYDSLWEKVHESVFNKYISIVTCLNWMSLSLCLSLSTRHLSTCLATISLFHLHTGVHIPVVSSCRCSLTYWVWWTLFFWKLRRSESGTPPSGSRWSLWGENNSRNLKLKGNVWHCIHSLGL